MTVRRAVTGCVTAALCSLPLVATPAGASSPPAGAGGALAKAAGAGRSLCAPPADTVGPAATRVTFGRSSISLDKGPRQQTVRVHAVDTSNSGGPSGVARVIVYVRGNRFFHDVRATLSSGTASDGTWTGHFAISKYARPGTYSIEQLQVVDRAGSSQYYPGYGATPESPNALSLHPSDDASFSVTGSPAPPPTRKPAGTLRSFGLGSTHVDTTRTSRAVRVTAQFAGAQPHRVYVEFVSRKESGARPVFLRAALRHGSSEWSGSLRVPRWLGRLTVRPYLFAEFGSGFRPGGRSYSPDALARQHFPTTLSIVSGLDRSKPTLHRLTFSPRSIDSTAGAEQVTVTARAGDVGSGVHSVEVFGWIRHGANGVETSGAAYPFAAAGIGYLSSDQFRVRLHRTATGTWSGTTTVRQCVPSGSYRLSADLVDVAHNYRSYSTRQLAAAHLPSRIDVTSKHGDIVAPYLYSEATFSASSQLFINFSEGVANVNTTTLSVYPLSPRKSRFTAPVAVSTIECDHGKTPVACSGADGLVTAAALTIPDLTPGVIYDIYANLDKSAAQLVDVNGNPLDWNSRAGEVKAS